MRKKSTSWLILFIFICSPIPSITLAQTQKDVQLGELTWTDQKYFEKQRKKIDALTRSDYGRPLRATLSDLRLLQRIIDDESIKTTDKQLWQAMGIVLGDVFVDQLGLQWRTYTDLYGRSRGVCAPKTQECLFPVTMFTRRVKTNSKPNVMAIYKKSLDLISTALPKTPYSVEDDL